ncbi:MAG: sodium:solute symporter family protein [Sandaracinaceae bacterium]|nr:sodium:solute symporter family protein [Sandaracinaceae bacterium]
MSEASWIVVGVAAAYLAACLALGTLSSRGQAASTVGYVAGDRSLGLVLMYFITGATIFSAFAFLGLPGWAYTRGAAAFYILGYGALGFVPFYFLGPRAARVGKKRGFVTQAEMVAARFESPAIAGVMALVSAVAFVPYLALQMKGAGLVLRTVTDGAVPEAAGAAIVYAVVLAYVLASGVLGVGWTNTFQGLFMIALAWGLGLYLPSLRFGGVEPMFRELLASRPELLASPGLAADGSAWHWGEYGSAVIVSVVGFSAWPHLFMKAFTAKDARTIRRTVLLYPTFQIFLLPLFLIGFAGVGIAPAPQSPDEILPHLLMQLEVSPWLVGLFCAGALAASMSSGDAMLHAVASISVRDGWIAALGRALAPARELFAIRALVVLYVIAAYAVAVIYEGSLVLLLLGAYGAIVQFMPGLVAALYWRRATAAGVLAGMLAGGGLSLVFVLAPEWRPFPCHAGLYGVTLNALVLVIVSRVTPPSASSDAFLRDAAGR